MFDFVQTMRAKVLRSSGVAAVDDYGWGDVAELLLQILYQSAQAARGYSKKRSSTEIASLGQAGDG